MTHADRTDVGIRTLFVRIVLAATEHLGQGLELGMDLEADGSLVRGFHDGHHSTKKPPP